jgi:NAD(P)-dependent dehydrogenase (short-subunit alcohol dehydrogenase family)
MQRSVAGKVAIVTGAAPQGPGIGNGSAVAILFAREGAQVVLVNRSEPRARALQRTIEAEGGDCLVCVADVTNAPEVERRFCRKVAFSSVLASVSHGISESRFSDFTPKIEICDRTGMCHLWNLKVSLFGSVGETQ